MSNMLNKKNKRVHTFKNKKVLRQFKAIFSLLCAFLLTWLIPKDSFVPLIVGVVIFVIIYTTSSIVLNKNTVRFTEEES